MVSPNTLICSATVHLQCRNVREERRDRFIIFILNWYFYSYIILLLYYESNHKSREKNIYIYYG
jgi:hypothetical protein